MFLGAQNEGAGTVHGRVYIVTPPVTLMHTCVHSYFPRVFIVDSETRVFQEQYLELHLYLYSVCLNLYGWDVQLNSALFIKTSVTVQHKQVDSECHG